MFSFVHAFICPWLAHIVLSIYGRVCWQNQCKYLETEYLLILLHLYLLYMCHVQHLSEVWVKRLYRVAYHNSYTSAVQYLTNCYEACFRWIRILCKLYYNYFLVRPNNVLSRTWKIFFHGIDDYIHRMDMKTL